MTENINVPMVNFKIPQAFMDVIGENSAPGNYAKILKDGRLEVTIGSDVRNLSEIKGVITATDYHHAKYAEGHFVRWENTSPPPEDYKKRVLWKKGQGHNPHGLVLGEGKKKRRNHPAPSPL